MLPSRFQGGADKLQERGFTVGIDLQSKGQEIFVSVSSEFQEDKVLSLANCS